MAASATTLPGTADWRRRIQHLVLLPALLALLFTSLASFSSPAASAPNPSVSIDQCQNGKYDEGESNNGRVACTWQNGNLGHQHAQYTEDDSVGFLAEFGSLEVGNSYTVTLKWDTLVQGDVAYDYLTSWDCTESGVAGTGDVDTATIPDDPRITAMGIVDQDGKCGSSMFELYGGDITAVGPYTYSDGYTYTPGDGPAEAAFGPGTTSTMVTVTFTADVADPILAFGGHVALRDEWMPLGLLTAVQVNDDQSSYHMAPAGLRDNDLGEDYRGGGDRSLKAIYVGPEYAVNLVKSADVTSADSGDTVVFTVTVLNGGQSKIDGVVTLTDDVPDEFTVATVAPSNACGAVGQLVTCAWNDLAVGDVNVVTITTTVAPNTCGKVANVATLSIANPSLPDEVTPDPASSLEVDLGTCLPIPSIVKTSTTPNGTAEVDGGAVSWTVTVGNHADALANLASIQVTDTVDAQFKDVAASVTDGTGTCSVSGNYVDCTLADLAPSASAVITITGTSRNLANSCGSKPNQAFLSYVTDDTQTGQRESLASTDDASVTVVGCGTVPTIVKSPSTQTIELGDPVSWTLEVGNDASATLTMTSIHVTDTVDAHFVVASATVKTAAADPGGGRCSVVDRTTDTLVDCQLDDLEPGASATITITATSKGEPDTCDLKYNRATVSDGSASATSSKVSVDVGPCEPDVRIEKSTSTSSIDLGGDAAWTVKVTNHGDASATATNLVITDTIDDRFLGVTATPVTPVGSEGTSVLADCSATSGRNVICTIASLPVGWSGTIAIAATHAGGPDSCAPVLNTARVVEQGGTLDKTTPAVESTVDGCDPLLTLRKELESTEPIAPGAPATFLITVGNEEGNALGGATVEEFVPDGWTLTGLSVRPSDDPATGGACSVATASCDVTVAAGDEVVVEAVMTAPTGSDACGDYLNEAGLAQSDHSASAEVTVNDGRDCESPPPPLVDDAPAIEVVKVGSSTTAIIGDVVTYTYTVTNIGDVTLVDVTLDDVVTAGGDTISFGLIELADGVTLAPGASTVATSTWTVTVDDVPGSIDNTAIATGRNGTTTVSDVDTWSVDVITGPAIAVVKTADATSVSFDGFEPVTITYTYEVTNIGDVPLTDVTAVDDILGPITLASTTLAPGESTTGTAVHGVTQDDADAGAVTNIVVASGTAPDGTDVQGEDQVTVTVTVPEVEVLGEVIEREPTPAVEPAVQELPATGIAASGLLALGAAATSGGVALLTAPFGRRRRRND